MYMNTLKWKEIDFYIPIQTAFVRRGACLHPAETPKRRIVDVTAEIDEEGMYPNQYERDKQF